MILFCEGNVLPVVTTTQILLRRYPPYAQIRADGIFGPKTKRSVIAFQRFHHLHPDGMVGPDTWGALMKVSGLQTIDVVDSGDPLLLVEVMDLRARGGDPIVVSAMCNGVAYAMNQIAARANGEGKVALLRIHGHGNIGKQVVTGGLTTTPGGSAPHLAAIANSNFEQLKGDLQRITKIFVGFASAQLFGCNVGRGSKGEAFLQKLALVWEVPVTAGIIGQAVGLTHYIDGPTVSGFPGWGNLKSWSKQQQESNGNMCMAK
jgi:peptidoglycan hydrolase-like protein with peptidoglycan-binding domain